MANDMALLNFTDRYGLYGGSKESVEYVAWVGSGEPARDDSGLRLPSAYRSLDTESADAARFFIMTNIGKVHRFTYQRKGAVNVTECKLHNATYEASFHFQHPGQTTDIKNLE
jgi:hypothetical protein